MKTSFTSTWKEDSWMSLGIYYQNPDETVAHLKSHFVAKGFSQTYGVDYQDTFSSVATMTSI